MGQAVPFHLERLDSQRSRNAPRIATHLLLVVAPGGTPLRQIADGLRPLLDANWRVSILANGGSQTPYVSNEAELQAALAGAPGRTSSIRQAASELRTTAGRRVLFAITTEGQPVDQATVQAARWAGATLYHVGGDPSRQRTPVYGESNLFQEFSPTGDVIASVVEPPSVSFSSNRIPGHPIEEKNLRSADEDALRDGAGYYDLELNLPATATAVDLGVKVFAYAKETFRVEAQPYALGRDAPTLILSNP